MADQPAKVALGLTTAKLAEVLTLTANVVGSMGGNKLFPTPAVDLDDLNALSKTYGDEETSITQDEAKLKPRRTANRGKLDELKKLLAAQGNYVNGVAQGSRATIEAAGMPASAEPTPTGKLPRVAGLLLSPGAAKGQVQVKWQPVSRKNGGSGYITAAPAPTR